jgi:DNA polymerase
VRGEPLELEDGGECWVTVHPSSLLRMPDPGARREGRALFVRDLKLIKARAEEISDRS